MTLKITRIFDEISFVLVCFSGLIVLLSSVEQLVGIPILKINFILSFYLAIVLLWLFYKVEKQEFAVASFASLLFIVFLIFVSGCVIDVFWDSNAYHKVAVGHLANGWNCVWQSLEDFLAASPFSGSEYLSNNPPWVEYFPKASWYYGASVYKVFHNIETAKSINLIMLSAAFLSAYSALEERFCPDRKSRCHALFAFIAAVIVACNPIALNQLFTLYVDGLLASIWTLVIISLFREEKCHRAQWMVFRFFLIIIGCNLKFTSGAIIGAFCIAGYFLKVVKAAKHKRISAMVGQTLYYAVCVIAAFGVVGAGCYIRNLVQYGHPFYPIMTVQSRENINVMAGYLPDEVEALPSIEKWALVSFSKTESARGDVPIHLKFPFSFHADELVINHIDTERGGMGPFYSGLLLVSVFAIFGWIFVSKKKFGKLMQSHWLVLACMTACVVLISIISSSWLARYSPYIYFPIMVSGVLLCQKMNSARWGGAKIIGLLFAGLVLINNILFMRCIWMGVSDTMYVKNIRTGQTENASTVVCYLPNYEGPIFNFIDEGFSVIRSYDTPEDLEEWNQCAGVYWRYE